MERRIGPDTAQVVQLYGKPLLGSGGVGVDRSVTATTSAATLMPANANRARFYVANDSTIDVYIRPGGAAATAVAGAGNVKVAANGGFFELAGDADAWSIIAASGTPAVSAREF